MDDIRDKVATVRRAHPELEDVYTGETVDQGLDIAAIKGRMEECTISQGARVERYGCGLCLKE